MKKIIFLAMMALVMSSCTCEIKNNSYSSTAPLAGQSNGGYKVIERTFLAVGRQQVKYFYFNDGRFLQIRRGGTSMETEIVLLQAGDTVLVKDNKIVEIKLKR